MAVQTLKGIEMLNPHQVHSHFVSSFAETRPFTDETEDHPTHQTKFSYYLSAWLYAKQHKMVGFTITRTGWKEYTLTPSGEF